MFAVRAAHMYRIRWQVLKCRLRSSFKFICIHWMSKYFVDVSIVDKPMNVQSHFFQRGGNK